MRKEEIEDDINTETHKKKRRKQKEKIVWIN